MFSRSKNCSGPSSCRDPVIRRYMASYGGPFQYVLEVCSTVKCHAVTFLDDIEDVFCNTKPVPFAASEIRMSGEVKDINPSVGKSFTDIDRFFSGCCENTRLGVISGRLAVAVSILVSRSSFGMVGGRLIEILADF